MDATTPVLSASASSKLIAGSHGSTLVLHFGILPGGHGARLH